MNGWRYWNISILDIPVFEGLFADNLWRLLLKFHKKNSNLSFSYFNFFLQRLYFSELTMLIAKSRDFIKIWSYLQKYWTKKIGDRSCKLVSQPRIYRFRCIMDQGKGKRSIIGSSRNLHTQNWPCSVVSVQFRWRRLIYFQDLHRFYILSSIKINAYRFVDFKKQFWGNKSPTFECSRFFFN